MTRPLDYALTALEEVRDQGSSRVRLWFRYVPELESHTEDWLADDFRRLREAARSAFSCAQALEMLDMGMARLWRS